MSQDGHVASVEKYLTVGEAAAFLSVSPRTVRNWDIRIRRNDK